MLRKTIIGVIGGNKVSEILVKDARDVGAAVTSQQQILLTGGGIEHESSDVSLDNRNVKDAAIYGAQHTDLKGATSRVVGILPSKRRNWDEVRKPCSLFLATGLSSEERDVINGVTPDVAIVFPGKTGTLCELAFVLQARKPVLYWKATAELRRQLKDNDKDVGKFLETALSASRTKLLVVPGITDQTTVLTLRNSLEQELLRATDFSGSVVQLVESGMKLAGSPRAETTFPGFRDEPNSKRKFDEIVQRISTCQG